MGVQASHRSHDAQVLMLGLDGSGKSTVLYRLKFNESVVTVPTVGFNVEMLEVKYGWGPGGTEGAWGALRRPGGRGALRRLTVWDVGGQKKMRPSWESLYPGTHGLVFVVDAGDRRRLKEAHQELQQVLRNQSARGVPLLILANKQDLPNAMSPAEITLRLGLDEQCEGRPWVVQPCAACSGAGLEEGFRKLAHLLNTSLRRSGEEGGGTQQRLQQLREKPKDFILRLLKHHQKHPEAAETP